MFLNINLNKMKKILVLVLIFLSVNCMAKSWFKKDFIKADSAFTQITDSLRFNQIISEIDLDNSKVTITANECLLLYFGGYINSYLNFKQKGSFDFDGLLKEIKVNKKLILKKLK